MWFLSMNTIYNCNKHINRLTWNKHTLMLCKIYILLHEILYFTDMVDTPYILFT